jgi:hypothetical protein
MLFTSRYSLQRRGPKRLVVTRSRTWSDVTLRLDGVELGRVEHEALTKGVDFALRDHSILRVWIEPGPRGSRFLYLTRNGHPLPGSDGDPVKTLRITLVFIWSIAALQMLFAAMFIAKDRADQVVYWTLALGFALVLLGILAWRRSVVAMVVASFLFLAEVLYFFVYVVNVSLSKAWNLVVLVLLLGWLLLRGIKAVRELKSMALPVRQPPEPMHPSDAA